MSIVFPQQRNAKGVINVDRYNTLGDGPVRCLALSFRPQLWGQSLGGACFR